MTTKVIVPPATDGLRPMTPPSTDAPCRPSPPRAAAPVIRRPGCCRPLFPLGDFRLRAAIETPLFQFCTTIDRALQPRRKLDSRAMAGVLGVLGARAVHCDLDGDDRA